MSNIPRARQVIGRVLTENKLHPKVRRALSSALRDMRRRQPDFRHPKEYRRLTSSERREARRLRRKYGFSLAKIARRLGIGGTGRISEAVNGYAH